MTLPPNELEALKRETHAQEFVRYCETDKDLIDCIIDHLASRLLPDGYVAVPETVMLDYESRLDMIRYLLPLAKGYVHANAGIRSTECIIEDAEAMIAAAKGE